MDVSAANTGSDVGAFDVTILPNLASNSRSGSIRIADQTLIITQAGFSRHRAARH
jgi:hypothetical protein